MDISKNGLIMYDCINHAGDHDVCTIVSTLTNVLVEATFAIGYEPTTYDEGHVRLDIPDADFVTMELFRIVLKQLKEVANQHPDYLKIY